MSNLTGKVLIYKGKANTVTLDSFTLGQGNWLIKPESANLNVKTVNKNISDITCLSTITQVNVISSNGNKYVFNGENTYDSSKKYGLYQTTYTFTNIPSGHPIAILNNNNSNISYTGESSKKLTKQVTGTTNDGTYDFYHGDITVSVSGNFGVVSVYCYYHGYMGGENLLKYSSFCENNSTDSTLLSIRNGKTVVDISQADSVTLTSQIQIGNDWKVNLGDSGARLNFINQDSTMVTLQE